MNCFTKEGIDAIKDALRAGEAVSTPEVKITINLITPPLFVVSTIAMLNKKKAFEVVDQSLAAIEAAIKERGGSYKLKEKPAGVGTEDKDFEEILGQQQNDNNDGEALQFDDEDEI